MINTNDVINYDIINNEGEIEYAHRAKLGELYKRDPKHTTRSIGESKLQMLF